jgi:hypothetical protein
MVSNAIVYVGIHWSIQANTVWVWKDLGISCCSNKTAKHLITRFDCHLLAPFVEDMIDLAPTIAAKRSI